MIPHGRTAIDGQQAAARLGKSYKTWQRNATTRYGLRPFNPGRRTLLYDLAQVEALRDGRPLPTWPKQPHPRDLLDEKEVAAELGIEYDTLRKYRHEGRHHQATQIGRIQEWVTVCGVDHLERSLVEAIKQARQANPRRADFLAAVAAYRVQPDPSILEGDNPGSGQTPQPRSGYTPTQAFLTTLQEILETLSPEPDQPRTLLALSDPVDGRTHQLELTPAHLDWLANALDAYEDDTTATDAPG